MKTVVRTSLRTTHIVVSVGWLGAVACFFVLSVTALASPDVDLVRGSYRSMCLLGWDLIIPLSALSLTTGLILALGTEWGLFRTYWVATKFALTCGATALLLVHQIVAVAETARRVSGAAPGTLPDLGGFGVQLVGDAGLALIVLIGITVLSVVKPWGRTAYGQRLLHRRTTPSASPGQALTQPDVAPSPVGRRLLWAFGGLVVVLALVRHLLGGGMGHHSH